MIVIFISVYDEHYWSEISVCAWKTGSNPTVDLDISMEDSSPNMLGHHSAACVTLVFYLSDNIWSGKSCLCFWVFFIQQFL